MNRVHRTDCMEFMKGLPDNSYDLAIVDPPYGIGKDGNKASTGGHGGRKAHDQKGWDRATPGGDYFTELRRVARNQIIWGANYFPENLNGSMGWIFWDKGQRISQSDGELAFTSFPRALRVIEINRVALLKEGTIHPTQKPVVLYKWLLQNYAKPGQTIFDSHVGSGSIRIACHDLGFDFEGCEIDEDYWTAQEERFKRHAAQAELFDTTEIQGLAFGKE